MEFLPSAAMGPSLQHVSQAGCPPEEIRDGYIPLDRDSNVVTLSSPMCQDIKPKVQLMQAARRVGGQRSVTLFLVLWERETDVGSWPKSQGSWELRWTGDPEVREPLT